MQNVLTDIKCGACAQFPIYSIVNRLFSFELCTFFGCCKTIGINPIALWLTGCADEILELHETNANINKGEKIRRNKKYIRIVRSTVDCRLTWNERIIWALDQACYCYIRMRYGLSLSLSQFNRVSVCIVLCSGRFVFAAIAVFVFRLHSHRIWESSISLSVQFFCRWLLRFILSSSTLCFIVYHAFRCCFRCVSIRYCCFRFTCIHTLLYAGVLLQGSACFYRCVRYGTHIVYGMRPFLIEYERVNSAYEIAKHPKNTPLNRTVWGRDEDLIFVQSVNYDGVDGIFWLFWTCITSMSRLYYSDRSIVRCPHLITYYTMQ